jgi:uncharacterized membrane protein
MNISKLAAAVSIGLYAIPVLLSLFWALAFIPFHMITVVINSLLYLFALRFSRRKLANIVIDSSS